LEENLRVIDMFVDALNRRDWDRVVELHGESVVYWTPDNSEPRKCRVTIRDLLVGYTSAFPDAWNRKERRSAMRAGFVQSTCSLVPTWDSSLVLTGI